LFHGNFSKDFAGFLLYIVVWLAPWFAILITDYLLRGRRYHTRSLQSTRRGLYWRNDGTYWPAVIAHVAGMVATLMRTNAGTAFPAYIGPISSHFPGLAGGDFGWALGIAVGVLAYWALVGRSACREEAEVARAPLIAAPSVTVTARTYASWRSRAAALPARSPTVRGSSVRPLALTSLHLE
jgi:purine-cytosine permease-like protein